MDDRVLDDDGLELDVLDDERINNISITKEEAEEFIKKYSYPHAWDRDGDREPVDYQQFHPEIKE